MTTTQHPIEINDNIATTWLPLTTAPAVPDFCSTYLYSPDLNSGGTDVYLYDPNQANALLATPCWPNEATLWWNQNAAVVTSLGPFVCPSGYTVAWSRDDQGANSKSQYTGCCPSGYDYAPGTSTPMQYARPGQCQSGYTSSEITYEAPNSVFTTSYEVDTQALSSGQVLLVYGVQVNGWNFPSDSSTITSTSAGAAAETTSSANTFASSTSTSTSSNSTSSSNSTHKAGLSAGATAGIGVAAAGAVILLASFLLFFFYRRHNLRKRQAAAVLAEPTYSDKFNTSHAAPGGAGGYDGIPQGYATPSKWNREQAYEMTSQWTSPPPSEMQASMGRGSPSSLDGLTQSFDGGALQPRQELKTLRVGSSGGPQELDSVERK